MQSTHFPPSKTVSQLISEPCQADTLAEIYSFPEATGQEIRRMMTRQGISNVDAAIVLRTTTQYIRSRKRVGTLKGRETWEFLRFLPQRFATLRSLNNPDHWERESERQSLKLFTVTNCSERIPCIGIKWQRTSPKEAVVINAGTKHKDATDILFGRLDNEWSSTETAYQLPVLTRRPQDHVRAYGSHTLMLAHEHIQEHWESLHSGDEIDLSIIGSIQENRRIVKSDLLSHDARSLS